MKLTRRLTEKTNIILTSRHRFSINFFSTSIIILWSFLPLSYWFFHSRMKNSQWLLLSVCGQMLEINTEEEIMEPVPNNYLRIGLYLLEKY